MVNSHNTACQVGSFQFCIISILQAAQQHTLHCHHHTGTGFQSHSVQWHTRWGLFHSSTHHTHPVFHTHTHITSVITHTSGCLGTHFIGHHDRSSYNKPNIGFKTHSFFWHFWASHWLGSQFFHPLFNHPQKGTPRHFSVGPLQLGTFITQGQGQFKAGKGKAPNNTRHPHNLFGRHFRPIWGSQAHFHLDRNLGPFLSGGYRKTFKGGFNLTPFYLGNLGISLGNLTLWDLQHHLPQGTLISGLWNFHLGTLFWDRTFLCVTPGALGHWGFTPNLTPKKFGGG